MDKDTTTISPKAFAHLFGEAEKCSRRFCFILGSGASRQAGIMTGVDMARQWSDQLKDKYEEKELKALMKKLKIDSIEPNSKNYFGIYDLRFYPDYQTGYAYFEKELEKGTPSLGHHVLAKILAGKKHNLAITTNFDSLIEDALFIYTNEHPLVVGHESLAQFINLNIERPVVAKIHRGLYYHPFNRQKEINALAEEWKNTLKNALMVYTPIVIGYAGGDKSLMKFLCDDNAKMNGMYWCYWNKEEPSQEIVDLVKSKDGCLVPIESFDQIMFLLSRKLGIENPEKEMLEVTQRRIENYNQQYDEFEERIKEASKEESSSNGIIGETLNAIDSLNEQLLKDTEKEQSPEAFYQKGNVYRRLEKYEEAINAYTKAIELNPEYSAAYNSCGLTYNKLGRYAEAINDFTKAILINPKYATAYNNRGFAHKAIGEYAEAIADYEKAIELNPKYSIAYNNLGAAYNNLEEYVKAITYLDKSLELNPEYALAYNNRGFSYTALGEYEKAIADCTNAIELNPKYSLAYSNRGLAYIGLEEYEKAIADCTEAIKLDPAAASAYKHMGVAYFILNDTSKALSNLNKAIELCPNYTKAYEMRAKVYRAMNKLKEAEKDEEIAQNRALLTSNQTASDI
ncbi:MAG: tetratricopeptide repeat protein [Lachnospiraceae bacterium]|nr:tetratricopeptide repeat protein [Lachnospiraceae bacterium]